MPKPEERIEIPSVSDMTEITLVDDDHHTFSSQFQHPKRSTFQLHDFLANKPGLRPFERVLDIGVDIGAIFPTVIRRWQALNATSNKQRKHQVNRNRLQISGSLPMIRYFVLAGRTDPEFCIGAQQ
jgi:hypothetical protein